MTYPTVIGAPTDLSIAVYDKAIYDLSDSSLWDVEALVVVLPTATGQADAGYIALKDAPSVWAPSNPVRLSVHEWRTVVCAEAVDVTASNILKQGHGNPDGDGIVTVTLHLPEIYDPFEAQKRADTEIVRRALAFVQAEFETYLRGYEPGKAIPYQYLDLTGLLEIQDAEEECEDLRQGRLRIKTRVSAATRRPVPVEVAVAESLSGRLRRHPRRQIFLGEPA